MYVREIKEKQIFKRIRWQLRIFESVFYKSLIRACSIGNSLAASQNARSDGQTSNHRHCLNAVSCAGVLADQRFAKNPSMEFVFRTSIFLCVFMNTRYISVIQLKISKHFSFLYTYHDSIKEEKENRDESMLL